jgi:hypothetical protein
VPSASRTASGSIFDPSSSRAPTRSATIALRTSGRSKYRSPPRTTYGTPAEASAAS